CHSNSGRAECRYAVWQPLSRIVDTRCGETLSSSQTTTVSGRGARLSALPHARLNGRRDGAVRLRQFFLQSSNTLAQLLQGSALIAKTRLQFLGSTLERANQRRVMDAFQDLVESGGFGLEGTRHAGARVDAGLEVVQVCVDPRHAIFEIHLHVPR